MKSIYYFKEFFQDSSGGDRYSVHFGMLRKEIITQQYPENKDTLKMFERFRGEVVLLHDENNEHKCTGCSACEMACPNGTIEIIAHVLKIQKLEEKKKVIDQFVYHFQMCTMCGNLCIPACPTDAIVMAQYLRACCF